MSTSRIVTDAGKAYAKCLGNPTGPHALACEWVGTRIAEILGLATLDFAQLFITADDLPFDLDNAACEEPGTAFVSRSERGFQWGGDGATLAKIANPQAVPLLVVLDTLLLNRDRCPPDTLEVNMGNVFLSQERSIVGTVTLLAMDHSHVLTYGGPITRALPHISNVKDDRVYGLFEAFHPFISDGPALAAVRKLGNLTEEVIEDVLAELPNDWEVDSAAKTALRTFLVDRRDYLAETLYSRISTRAGPQRTTEDGGPTT